MSAISFPRLARLLRYELGISFRKDLITYGSFAVGIFFLRIGIFSSYTDKALDSDHLSILTATYSFTSGLLAFFVIALTIYASGLQYGANEKNKRHNMLMIPASKAEKYLVHFFHVTVPPTIAVIAGILISDLLHYLTAPLFGFAQSGMLFFEVFSEVWSLYLVRWQQMLPELSILLCLHAFFICGGAFFRRNPFWLTVLTNFLLFLLLLAGVGFYANYILDVNEFSFTATEETARISIIVFHLVYAALLYVASYFIFTREEILGRTWCNI